MKKMIALLLALIMVFSLVACSGSADTAKDTTTTDSTTDSTTTDTTGSDTTAEPASTEGSVINVCLASEPDTIDPALNSAVDGATMLAHLFSGLAKWSQDADGNLQIVADAATELPEGVENEDGTVTYTYTLRDGLVWSDGQPVTAGDFAFAWQRAASPELAADYGYMFEVVDGYADIWATDDAGNFLNPDAQLNVVALDEKTLQVTTANYVAYWNELLAFPTYFPVREDVVSNDAWATDPSTYVCNGPYTMESWEHNSVITLVKNPNFYDADEITMETINFYLSDDANNMLSNFKNGDWELIDDVPTNEIASLKAEYPDEFVVAGQIGTYYVCWNINEDILPASSTLTGAEAEQAKAEIRNAIGLLFDRNYIVEEIGQAGQIPASSFVAMGMTNPDGTQFYETAGHSDDYVGYYDVSADAYESNFESAVETLKKYYTYDESTGMFTDFPTLTYLYNTSDAHKAVGEALQQMWQEELGVTVQLQNQEWNAFLETRKKGEYQIARNGWIADYNDPCSFLDMWYTGGGNNDAQYSNPEYDAMIDAAKATSDPAERMSYFHQAEDIIIGQDWALGPIYFYTQKYMMADDISGAFYTPLGYFIFGYCTKG